MIEFEVLSYQAPLDEPIARLFAKEGFERPAAYLSWIFNPPNRRGLVAIARDGAREGRIVGVLGLVPTPVHCSGRILDSHLAIDLVVNPDYRGRGIFMGLGRIALEASATSGAELVWGFPNQSAAHAWFNRFSWINLGSVPLLCRPLRTGFALGRLSPRLARFDVPLIRSRRTAVGGMREVTRFGRDADLLWHRFARRVGCCSVRDSESLNWRLFDRPGAAYRTVASFDPGGAMRALVSSTVEHKLGGKILFIIEAMSDSEDGDESLAQLINHELRFAAACGADAALCWSPPSAPNRHVYRKAAFLPVPESLRPSKSFFGMKPTGAAQQEFSRDWYISYFDLDVL